jgi:hypothetical protein
MSSVLVALTVEIDNAYEARAPHSTTKHGGTGPWLTSYVMWANLLRLVPQEGIAVRDLARCAGYAKRPHPAQAGMERWGYIAVTADPRDARAKPPRSEMLVRRTPAGERAAGFWTPLAAEVEERWCERYGSEVVGDLRRSLESIVDSSGARLPAYLPQLDGSLWTIAPHGDQTVLGPPSLVTALANCTHLFAIDFEAEFPVSLAVAANVLRVLDADGIRVRDIAPTAGISAEAVRWILRVLDPAWAEQIADPDTARGKLVRLTRHGDRLRSSYEKRIDEVERSWATQHAGFRTVCDSLAGMTADGALLRSGMIPPGSSWRPASPPAQLPAFPVVLHRGGFPDGS